MNTQRGRRRALRRWIANPVVSVVLVALLVLDAANLPWNQMDGGDSVVGRFMYTLRGGARVTIHYFIYDAVAVKEPGGIRILQPHIESMDETTRLLSERPEAVLILSYSPRTLRSGVWAITQETMSHAIQMSGGSALTPEDRLAARRMMVQTMVADGAALDPVLKRLSREDFSGSRVIWGGVAHNVLALAGFVLLCLSLGWIPGYWAAAKRRRARSALWRGECPGCGYSLLGLQATVCPECGREVKDPGAGPGS